MKLKLNIKNPQLAKALGKKDKEKSPKAIVKDEKAALDLKNIKTLEEENSAPKRKIKAKKKSDFIPQEENVKEVIKVKEKSTLSEKTETEQNEEKPPKEPVAKNINKPKVEIKIEKIAPEKVPAEEKKEAVAKPIVTPKPVVTPKPALFRKEGALGPTGRHINDLMPKIEKKKEIQEPPKSKPKPVEQKKPLVKKETPEQSKKPFVQKKQSSLKPITAKDRGKKTFGEGNDSFKHRRMKRMKTYRQQKEEAKEIITDKPKELSLRLPIALKDLAIALKIKASEIITKLFMQGIVATLNDALDDETTVQLIGEEFKCSISIDTSEEEKIRITDETIREEISTIPADQLEKRPAVITFMGHVDHGKTSLIDYIRKSNIADGEKGAITQHIGAFTCNTSMGKVTILDTPGHEAFSAMRARGADVTDIVVLVVAGDEGVKQQTIEAIHHAKAAGVITIVAINKCDKESFNADTVYRQLADNCLVPEAWGGDIITVNCSATTGEGISDLLEMLGLQSEILELKANPNMRARGSVVEACMHKGLGAIATLLVQNGTLKKGDSIVFTKDWGRVKTLRDELDMELDQAGPSHAVRITGLSGIPEAGSEFIVVSSEKEARKIAEMRQQDLREKELLQSRQVSLENILQKAQDSNKKILNIILRADTHGSVEALKHSLMKIKSDKAEINIIFAAAGEISESDIQLASASRAIIIGFHTQIESHADSLGKEMHIMVRMHDIIYHAIEDTEELLLGTLDKVIQENETGIAEVLMTFKASQLGLIAGCLIKKGKIHRNHKVRLLRDDKKIWEGSFSSIRRDKNDVRDVSEGFECGIVLDGYNQIEKGDIIQAYEIKYINQEL